MSVRAKFNVQKIESTQYHRARKGPDGKPNYQDQEVVEMRSVHLQPVYGNGDPDHENTKFWDASPSGSLVLGTINPSAWKYFELGGEYYVDFTKAE